MMELQENIRYNKILEITSEDVMNQKDLIILNEWKRVLIEKIDGMKTRIKILDAEFKQNSSEENKSNFIRTNDARKHNQSFLDIICKRIKSIKKKNGSGFGRKIKSYINFKNIAKEVLPSELYDEINLRAKLLTDEEYLEMNNE